MAPAPSFRYRGAAITLMGAAAETAALVVFGTALKRLLRHLRFLAMTPVQQMVDGRWKTGDGRASRCAVVVRRWSVVVELHHSTLISHPSMLPAARFSARLIK